jgi:eukaryotic-like serine/threonine-protein kinase
MKLLDGKPYSKVIAEFREMLADDPARTVEFRRLLGIFVDVCHAIEFAHQRNVLHRDLKPDNVMVGRFGEAIVVDWGLAKAMHEAADESSDDQEPPESDLASTPDPIRPADVGQASPTRAGTVMGTPAYMPPEQACGDTKAIDQRTDIFSLGAILFELLTGRAPVQGKTLTELLTAARRANYDEPRSVDRSVPPALNAVCVKALAARPANRYQSAHELSDEITRWLAHEPVLAWPEPWWTRAERWVKKHKALVASVAAASIAIMAISILVAVLIDQSRRAEQAARLREEKALVAEKEARRLEKSARLAEHKAKIEATESLEVALTSADDWLLDVSYALTWFPELNQTRHRLLQAAAQHYREFADRTANDLPLKIEVAKAQLRLGDATRMLGDLEQSKAAFESAVSQFKALARANPDNSQVQLQLGNSHTGLAMLLALADQAEETEHEFAAARAVLEALTKKENDDAQIHDAHGRCLNSQALFLNRLGDNVESIQLLSNAIEQFTRATQLEDRQRYQRRLASAQLDLGHVLNEQGKRDLASQAIRSALAGYTKLLLKDPKHPQLLQGAATARLSLADALRGRSDKTVADAYAAAISNYEELFERQPRVLNFLENLAIAQLNSAQFQLEYGNPLKAKELADNALGNQNALLKQDGTLADYHDVFATIQQTLGEIHRETGNYDSAKIEFEAAIQRFGELKMAFKQVLDYQVRWAECQSSLGQLLTDDRREESRKEKHAKAREHLKQADLEFKQVLQNHPKYPAALFGQAMTTLALARLELEVSNRDAAAKSFDLAVKQLKTRPEEPSHQYQLGWLYANCELVASRNPIEAIKLAGKLTQQFPANANYWTLLAMAQYRADKWPASIAAIEKAKSNRVADDVDDAAQWLILAMSRSRLNDAELSQSAYDRGLQAMQKWRPGNRRVIHLVEEAGPLIKSR